MLHHPNRRTVIRLTHHIMANRDIMTDKGWALDHEVKIFIYRLDVLFMSGLKGTVCILWKICPKSDLDIAHLRCYLGPLKIPIAMP